MARRWQTDELMIAASALGFAAWALVEHLRKRNSARAGVVSIEPVEMIDAAGNVTTKPTGTTEVLVPRPGEVTNVDVTPDAGTAYLCARAPLRSFGPACEGYNWIRQDTFPYGKIDLRTLN